MIYDHGSVGDWRARVGKEEKASEDALHRFIDLKKGRTRPKSACNPLKFTARNGPWASGQNYADARFDQPFPDMVERRILQNVQHFERTGFGRNRHTSDKVFGEPVKSRPATATTGSRRSTHRTTSRSYNSRQGASAGDVNPELIRISPLTEYKPVEKTTNPRSGLCRRPEWDMIETDAVKQQLEQERLISTIGHQTHIDLCKQSPLTRPAAAEQGSTPRGVIKPSHYVKIQLAQRESAQQYLNTKKQHPRSRPSSSRSRTPGSTVGKLISRMKTMENELHVARHERLAVEGEMERLLAQSTKR